MKKNYIFKTFLLLIPVTAFALMSLSGGRNGSYSGSPGDSNTTCTQCHSGGNFGTTITLQTEVPATGYELNTSYDIQIDVSGTAAVKHGFQITAEKVSDGSKIGTFTADGTNNQLVNGGTHVTHTATGNSLRNWTVSWKAPATDQGAIKFYVASVAANGNGSTSGDQVLTTTSASFSLGIREANRLEFSMFPNPSTDVLNVQLPSGVIKGSVQLFDYTGKLILSKEVTPNNQSINVKNLSKGIYLLKIAANGKLGAQQFVKE